VLKEIEKKLFCAKKVTKLRYVCKYLVGWRENLLPEVDAVLVLKTVRIGRSTVHEFVDHVLVVEAEDPLADEEGLEAEAVQVQGQPLQLFPLQELTRVPTPGCKPLKRLPKENVNLCFLAGLFLISTDSKLQITCCGSASIGSICF
jgi:hypothetical protein